MLYIINTSVKLGENELRRQQNKEVRSPKEFCSNLLKIRDILTICLNSLEI